MCERLFKALCRVESGTFWDIMAAAGPRGRANLAAWSKTNEAEARRSLLSLVSHGYVTLNGSIDDPNSEFSWTGKEWEVPKKTAQPVGGAGSYF